MDNDGSLKRVWVEMELPEGGGFSCWTETNWILSKNSLNVFVDSLLYELNGNSVFTIDNLIIPSIKKANELVTEILECCSATNSLCAECPGPEEILNYYRSEGYSEEKIQLLVDSNGYPMILGNEESPLVMNFSDYVYISKDEYMPEIFDKAIDPFNSLLWEMEGLNAPEDFVAGVILSNEALCSSPPIAAIRSSTQEAIDLFNSGFNIDGRELVIVKHIWQNPDGSGNDLLFTKYLYATYGNLEEIPVPLNPGMLNGQSSPTIYSYPLTDPNSPNAYEGMYEIAPDDNGTYFGWRIVNGEWTQLDIVEVSTPYPTNHDPEQYLIGQQVAEKIEYEEVLYYPPVPFPNPVSRTKKLPCRKCYDYSIGDKKDTPTNEIIKWFYRWFGAGSSFQEEKDILFNSFIYGQNQPLVWPANSELSEALYQINDIQTNLDASESFLRNYIIEFGDLNGITDSIHKSIFEDITFNPDLSWVTLPSLWSLQMFGGTQARQIRVVKFREINSQGCPGKNVKVRFIFTLFDCFGLGIDERWWIPGLPWQWVLQHYRNWYCCNFMAFHPVVYHQIEFEREFVVCIE